MINNKKELTIFSILLLFVFSTPTAISQHISAPFKVEITKGRNGVYGIYRSFRDRVLTLALHNTKKDFGDYDLRYVRYKNLARSHKYSLSSKQNNFLFSDSYRDEYAATLQYIPIPLELGIVGYRICFVHRDTKAKIAKADSLEELQRYSIGVRRDWLDYEILKRNGFKTVELNEIYNRNADTIENKFFPSLVAAKRFDLYCRGINEFKSEWKSHAGTKGLSYDESFALYYQLPRFFWTNKENTELIQRLTVGMKRALEDGSYQDLWNEYFLESVRFANMKSRRLYRLENPDLINVMDDYSQYFVDPFNLD